VVEGPPSSDRAEVWTLGTLVPPPGQGPGPEMAEKVEYGDAQKRAGGSVGRERRQAGWALVDLESLGRATMLREEGARAGPRDARLLPKCTPRVWLERKQNPKPLTQGRLRRDGGEGPTLSPGQRRRLPVPHAGHGRSPKVGPHQARAGPPVAAGLTPKDSRNPGSPVKSQQRQCRVTSHTSPIGSWMLGNARGAASSEEAIKMQAPEEDAKAEETCPVPEHLGNVGGASPCGSGPTGAGARMPTGAHTLSPSPRIPGASATQEEQASCAPWQPPILEEQAGPPVPQNVRAQERPSALQIGASGEGTIVEGPRALGTGAAGLQSQALPATTRSGQWVEATLASQAAIGPGAPPGKEGPVAICPSFTLAGFSPQALHLAQPRKISSRPGTGYSPGPDSQGPEFPGVLHVPQAQRRRHASPACPPKPGWARTALHRPTPLLGAPWPPPGSRAHLRWLPRGGWTITAPWPHSPRGRRQLWPLSQLLPGFQAGPTLPVAAGAQELCPDMSARAGPG
ncbi:hypothetical protein EI555_019465, partial [Monodon monoceros]